MANYTYSGTPSGQLLRGGKGDSAKQPVHECCLPDRDQFTLGTVWQCDCKVRWKVCDGYWARRLWPWPRCQPTMPLPKGNLVSSAPTGEEPPGTPLQTITRKEVREIKRIEKSLRG